MCKKKLLSVLLFCILSCGSQEFKITNLNNDEDFNNKVEFGYQYFDIEGYKTLSDSILMKKILYYSEQELSTKSLMPPKVEAQYFYEKKICRPCLNGSTFREKVRDGEYGNIDDCNDLKVAFIWYSKQDTINNTFTRYTVVYTKNGWAKFVSSRDDSLKIVGTKWVLLKRGKIEKNEIK